MRRFILFSIFMFCLAGCVNEEVVTDDTEVEENVNEEITELNDQIITCILDIEDLEERLDHAMNDLTTKTDEVIWLNNELNNLQNRLSFLENELKKAEIEAAALNEQLEEENKLVIKNLMVYFDDYNPITNRAGAFVFDTNYNKVFLEFGAVVNNGEKELPTFEYRTAIDAEVFAVADAFVTNIIYQENTDDYEIHTAPAMDNSDYLVSYDHVKNVQVEIGDEITAGQLLGIVGTWTDTMGRTELMITIPTSTSGIGQCPFKYFDERLIDYYENKVYQLMRDWETAKGDESIYDEENHVWAGCIHEEMYDE